MKIKSFIILTLLFFMTGCSNNEDNGNTDDRVLVELNVNTDISYKSSQESAITRSPVIGWSNTKLNMAYAKYNSGDENNINYTLALEGFVDNKGKTTFTPLLFYPAGDNEHIALRGFHPRIDPETIVGDIINNNIVKYSISGQEDIMLSPQIKGDKNNTFQLQGVNLQYEHLLTRLAFDLRCSGGLPETLTITEINITGVYKDAELNLLESNVEEALKFKKEGAAGKINVYKCTGENGDNGIILSEQSPGRNYDVMFEPKAEFGIEVKFSTGDIIEIDKVLITDSPVADGINTKAVGDNLLDKKAERSVYYSVYLKFKCVGAKPEIVVAQWQEVDTEKGAEDWW